MPLLSSAVHREPPIAKRDDDSSSADEFRLPTRADSLSLFVQLPRPIAANYFRSESASLSVWRGNEGKQRENEPNPAVKSLKKIPMLFVKPVARNDRDRSAIARRYDILRHRWTSVKPSTGKPSLLHRSNDAS